MKKFQFLFLFLILASASMSQKQNAWSKHTASSQMPTDKGVARLSFPKEFKLFDLDITPLRQELFKVVDNSLSHSTVITLPNADGEMEEFEVYEASNFEPALQARFPEIRAFSGRGITDRYAMLKLSLSPQGIQTMVFRADKPSEFIEPYSLDHTVYAVFKKQRNPGQLPWVCSTVDEKAATSLDQQMRSTTARSTGDLKTMRLAQSCNAEYSNYFGATSAAQVNLVLAAFNATLTRCNGCYEKDLALHFNLIANSTSVIYYDAATDPYTTMSNWNSQLQSTLTSVIGEANYDIGHMFGRSGGGGNAGCIGCICVNGQKGSGITSPADGIPQGDNFDIDYVVHEVGHQLGANHTFSMSLEGTGVNKEIGSGITAMGYAGITSQDVASHSIDIFHEATIAQIQANLLTKTCPVTTSLAGTNATPVVAPVSNYIIPKSTPFALTGSATDADGDPITYCWEQNDNSTVSGAASVASATKTGGPNWLSFSPSASPTRICPQLDRILTGQLFTGPLAGGDAGVNIEYLSSVARTLNFRLTVRDNAPYSSTAPVRVGQTQFTDMTVTVNGTAGPFAVTEPNVAGVSWMAGSTQTVSWSVNGSDQAPVSCANVNILLSIDGGYTWPVTIVSNTPNDGTETITVPNNLTTTARIKVESVGNIFFDINNANFAITAPFIGFAFSSSAGANVGCATTSTATASLGTVSSGGFVTPINLSASGNPAGTTVSFSTNPVTPGSSTLVTLNNVSTLAPGTYNVTINGVAGANLQSTTIAFVVADGAAPIINQQPADVIVCSGSNATFTSTATGSNMSYQWQLSNDGGNTWNNIPGANASSYTIINTSITQNNYKYRIQFTQQCGSSTSNDATLIVRNSTSSTSNITACNSYSWHGNIYTSSGVYSYTTINAMGCDSLALLNLTINSLPQGVLGSTTSFCSSGRPMLTFTSSSGNGPYTIVYNDGTANRTKTGVNSGVAFAPFISTIYQTTVYTLVSVTTANGCQRTSGFIGNTATAIVNQPTSSATSITSCNTYSWNGNIYSISGTYSALFSNVMGCDSTAILYLNITTPVSNSFTLQGCNSVTYNGLQYTAPAVVHDTVRTAFGCDSIYNEVTIQTACDGFLELIADSVFRFFDDTLRVSVKIKSGVDIFSTYAYLGFDNTYLNFSGSNMGTYLGSNVISQNPVVTGNQINFGMTKTGAQSGSNGDGTIYNFKFTRKTPLPSNILFNITNPNSYRLIFNLSNITVYNRSGIQPASFNTYSVTRDTTLYQYYVPVWPGDLNNDKIVNVADLLPIGYFYGSTGTARPNGNLFWTAQPSPLWGYDITSTNSNGYKCFADGNADGRIDLADQTAIGFNLSQTHARISDINRMELFSSFPTNQPALNVNIPDTGISIGDLPGIQVVQFNLGNAAYPVNNLYGLAFDIYFNSAFVDVASILTDYSGSVFGNEGVDFVKMEDYSNASNGKISIALTRFNSTNISGSGGRILNMQFPLLLNTPGGWCKIIAIPIAANDLAGNAVSITGNVDSIHINTFAPCVKNYWIGSESTAWENPANWSCGTVPDANTEVYIEGIKPYYPVVKSFAVCKSLNNGSGVSIRVKTGFRLSVVGP